MAAKYDHIDFKPPKSVADTAARGLALRQKAKKSHKGGLTAGQAKKEGVGSGVQRAVNLKNRSTLSPSTVRRMLNFFNRHQKNAKIDPGKTALTDKGKQSWDLWGGNAGYAWARKVVRQMNAADEKAKSKKKSRASLMPFFEQIVRLAGVTPEALNGIRMIELVELAGTLDAAGLYSEADALDSMLYKMAADFDTQEGDPLTELTEEEEPSPYRDYSEEQMLTDRIEDTVTHSTPEELGEKLKRRFEEDVGLQVRTSTADGMVVLLVGEEHPFKVMIDTNKEFTVEDRDGVQHHLIEAAHSLFRDDWAYLYEEFIMGPKEPK